MLKAQLRLGETVEDRQRFESDAEAVRQAKEALPLPEYRHYYGNWGIRIPMEVRAQQSGGKLLLLIEFDADINITPEVCHEIEHHTEKMNQAVALAARRDL
jgi:hypothetical protein